ncbi:MAG: ankyrin repeat domain-containing protein [Micavibrio sp.]|nr:ankyrin repeat domain-containing protein [Micavibrio sp.]
MKKLFNWNEPADRTTFGFTAIIALLCIYLFPLSLNNFLFSAIGGAELSGPRMVLRALIMPLAIVFICIPLLTITRRRLLDLDLSGVLLFAFPVWPLVPLAAGPLLAVVMFPLGGQQALLLNSDFYLGIICLLLLALAPGRTSGGPPKHPLFLTLQRLTESTCRIDAAQFRKIAFLLVGSSIGLSVLPLLVGKMEGLAILAPLGIIAKIATTSIVLILTANAIRRLNDLGRGYLWSAFFPLFLPSLLGNLGFLLLFSLGSPSGFSSFTHLLFARPGLLGYIPIAGIIGFFAVFVWLVSGKTSEHPIVDSKSSIPSDTVHSQGRFFSKGKVALTCLAAILVILTIHKTEHPYDYYRYRMTVTIETPEGLKTGSAVRQGNYEGGSERRASWTVGEAVVVDLGKRGLAFALIDGSNIGDGISYVATCDLREFGLKKTPIGTKWVLSPGEYPKLVAFKDLNNPKTMQSLLEIKGNGFCGSRGQWETQSDHFEEMFGTGVKLKEITLEITDDPITIGIERRLPWLYCTAKRPPGKRFSEPIVALDVGTLKREPREYYLKKMKDDSKETDKPECAAFREHWASYDRKKFQDDLQHWQQLADQESAEAQFEIGNLVAKGDGHEISANRDEALKWYKLAANQGYQDAQEKLARIYEYREGVAQDWQEAYFWASLATLGTGGHKLPNNQNFALAEAPKHITPEQKLAVETRVREWRPVISPGITAPITDTAALSERLLDAAYAGQTEMAKLLVERGADINSRNNGGNTPLMLAAMHGDVELIRYLSDKGADINAIGSGGWTALFMAAQGGHTEVAKVLLEKGIDFSVKDKAWGRTAQQVAEVSHHMDTAAVIAEFAKKQKP